MLMNHELMMLLPYYIGTQSLSDYVGST